MSAVPENAGTLADDLRAIAANAQLVPYRSAAQIALLTAADALEIALRDVARYRYLRSTVFTRDVAVAGDFTGDVIIAPPRMETYDRGIPIMTNPAHGAYLDLAIDEALARAPVTP